MFDKIKSGMEKKLKIDFPEDKIASFCQKNHIYKLAIFGSALREDFHAGSDIDFLVEFEKGYTPGFIRLADMEIELSKLLGGKKVDIRTPEDLSKYFRDEVLSNAEVKYVQG